MRSMNKMKILCFALIAVFIVTACGKKEVFKVNTVADDMYYDMTFDWLNTVYTYDIYLEQGDSIEIFLEKERGKVSVLIQIGDEEPVYQGDDMAPSSFVVNIKKTGNYTVKISGQKAKGHVSFSRQDYNEINT